MTELEQLRADLATLEAALNVQGTDRGFNQFTRMEIVKVQDKIADLYEPQKQVDPWERARGCVVYALRHYLHNSNGREIALYARHLEAKVAELELELRCERIDGGKVRDDQKAINAEKNREKLAELNTISNAIPPVCGLARELVEKRIEGVKKEMQG